VIDHPIVRDGLACFYCGCRFGDGKRALTLDHWIPVTLGGGSDLANLRLSCSRCNALKGDTVGDVFVISARLAARRAVVADEDALASGEWAPRRMYHHPQLTWTGPWAWTCAACGRGGSTAADSPARTLCVPTDR
jgi:hypothetical protein